MGKYIDETIPFLKEKKKHLEEEKKRLEEEIAATEITIKFLPGLYHQTKVDLKEFRKSLETNQKKHKTIKGPARDMQWQETMSSNRKKIILCLELQGFLEKKPRKTRRKLGRCVGDTIHCNGNFLEEAGLPELLSIINKDELKTYLNS